MDNTADSPAGGSNGKVDNRDANGRFLPGTSGNPRGRPLGSRNRAALLVESLLEDEAETLVHAAVSMAINGEPWAMRLCLERLLPPQRERPLSVDLPEIASSQDLAGAFGSITTALGRGELTPSETRCLLDFLENARRMLETTEVSRRIRAINDILTGAPQPGSSES